MEEVKPGTERCAAGWTMVAQGGGDGAHDSGTAPWQRQNLQKNRKEAAAKLKNNKGKGNRDERGRCSHCGSRVAARRASRYCSRFVLARQVLKHIHKGSQVRSMARRPTRPFAQPRLSLGQPRWSKWRGGSQCAGQGRGLAEQG